MAGRVLFFGRLRDLTGTAEAAMPADWTGLTLAEVRERAASLWPGLADDLVGASVRIALERELVTDEARTLVVGGEELAFLPPLSGG